MTIHVHCHSCGTNLRVKDSFAGTTIGCRECDKDILVPKSKQRSRSKPNLGEDNEKSTRPRKRLNQKKKSDTGMLIRVLAIIFAFLLISGGVIVGGLYMVSGMFDYDEIVKEDDVTQENVAVRQEEKQQRYRHIPQRILPGDWSDQDRVSNKKPVVPQKLVRPQPKIVTKPPPVKIPVDVKPVIPAKPIPSPAVKNLIDTELFCNLPRNEKSRVTFSAPGHRFVEVDGSVYEVETKEKVGAFEIPAVSHHSINSKSLSPDGKHIAMGVREIGSPRSITIFSLDNDKPKLISERLLTKKKSFMQFNGVWFIDNARLLFISSASGKDTFYIWDIDKHQKITSFSAGKTDFRKRTTISSDGMLIARCNSERIEVIDIKSRKVVATMELPRYDGKYFTSKISTIQFSPDHQELAAYLDVNQRLVVWSAEGKIVFDESYPAKLGFGGMRKSSDLLWLSDKKGWLVKQTQLIDRKSKKIVWKHKANSRYSYNPVSLLGDQAILISKADGFRKGNLVKINIPWQKIKMGLTSFDVADLIIKKGDSVTIELEIKEIKHSTVAEVKAKIQSALLERLSAEGIKISPQSDIILRVVYNEFPGGPKKYFIRERGKLTDPSKKQVTTLQETKSTMEVKLISRKTNQQLWGSTTTTGINIYILKELNDKGARDSMFRIAVAHLRVTSLGVNQSKTNKQYHLPIKTE